MTFYNEKLFEENPRLTNGNLQIIACAGAGKTDFISERVAYQIYWIRMKVMISDLKMVI